MDRQAVLEAVAAQFDRAWDMFRGAVRAFPETEWRKGEPDRLAPARLALHVIAPAVFYGEANSHDTSGRAKRLGRAWADAPLDELPDQKETLAWLDRIEPPVRRWLCDLGDDDALAPQEEFRHTGANRLERAVYLLRHIQHHVGEMNAECCRRGIPRPKWK